MWKIKQVCHPMWLYLNQPIFSAYASAVWQPHRFWYFYKIQLLESCWERDINSESHYTQ